MVNNRLKVLYTTASMGINSGGPTSSVNLTVQGLANLGVCAEIITYDVSKGDRLSTTEHVHIMHPSRIKLLPSREYKKFLNESEFDLFNAQGMWLAHTHLTALVARKLGKPYIITPRGMLYPQDIEKSNKFLKRFLLRAYLINDLNRAAMIHATCREEMEYIRNLGVSSPIAVIPNPIDISNIVFVPEKKERIRIGYLGRIHFRKRIERIIYAYARMKDVTSIEELVIIGDGDKKYLDFLKREVLRLKLPNVTFTGFLSGIDKDLAIKSLSYLVVPSDFENFGNIVSEALVRGVPVIASRGMPWEDLAHYKCGWWIDNDIESIVGALSEAIVISAEERMQMGIRGRELIREKYSSEIVSKKMKKLFEFLLNNNEKPEFVYLN